MAVLDLLDYRRQVAGIYQRVRATDDPRVAWERWVDDRQRLFARHPQSPWEPSNRRGRTLTYFPYDPAWRFEAEIQPLQSSPLALHHSSEGTTPSAAVGWVILGDHEQRLTVFWIEGYGGGLFLPFGDVTNGATTYGGGRYLLDTVKGADLGGTVDRLVLDFNFAYHPSCVHSARWSCPLQPPGNRLPVAVEAGERLP